LNNQTKPTLIHLTENKHNHIKFVWREVLKQYKVIHASPKLDPTTNRRWVEAILAARRDTYKDATDITTPSHLRDYISAAKLTSHNGSPIIAISAYMPQLHTKSQETLYIEILKWIHTDIISKYPLVINPVGGDFQATPWEGDARSYYAPLKQLRDESGLKHTTPKDTHTFIPAKTTIDH
jgi:hypothetical protein